MSKQITIDGMLRRSANHDKRMWRNIAIAVAVIVALFVGGILLAGCAPTHDAYLATRFAAFNEDVQGGLADCIVDPNECRRVLEWIAPETARWNEILGDPNL